jgi:lipoprotein-releasing system permease protein
VYRSFLSWRYLFARRANLIGVLGILVGVAALIVINAIMTGFLEQSKQSLRGSLADVIVAPDFGSDAEADPLPRSPQKLLDAVRSDARVRAATAQLIWGGIITQKHKRLEQYLTFPVGVSNRLLAVELFGVDVRTHERVFWVATSAAAAARGAIVQIPPIQDEFDVSQLGASLDQVEERPPRSQREQDSPVPGVAMPAFPFLPPPGFVSEGLPLDSVVIGDTLFRNLRLQRGDVIQIVTAVRDPATGEFRPNNRNFVVAGAFSSRENETDVSRIYLDRRVLKDVVEGVASGREAVILALEDYGRDSKALVPELHASLAQAGVIAGGADADEIVTWEAFRGNLLGAIENERVMMAIMLSLVLVVAGFCVFAIVSQMVTEKRRDIGVLQALGATPTGICQLFLLIAFWDALLGSLLGALVGCLLAVNIDGIEQNLSQYVLKPVFGREAFDRTVYIFDYIPSVIEPQAVALIVISAFLAAFLFSAAPAWRAARQDPLEGLRYE